jgi:lipid-binding SYLF domain-containing protein
LASRCWGSLPCRGIADAKTDQRLADARQVFETFVDIREQVIPTWLMERAYGIVVVPRVIKGALIIGGRGGKGVFSVRNLDGVWSDPVSSRWRRQRRFPMGCAVDGRSAGADVAQ